MLGKRTRVFNDGELRAFTATLVTDSLDLILPVARAVKQAMRPAFLAYIDGHTTRPKDKAIDLALSRVSLSWTLALYLKFYLDKTHGEHTPSYEQFLQRLLHEIDAVANKALDMRVVTEFAAAALQELRGDDAARLWWNMFYRLHDIEKRELLPHGPAQDATLSNLAAEILELETRRAAEVKQAFQRIAIAG